MLKKTGYQIYPCYSNEFDKNILISRAFKKILLKWTEFWLSDSSTSEKGLHQMVLEQKESLNDLKTIRLSILNWIKYFYDIRLENTP